jgi:hypothetical protein
VLETVDLDADTRTRLEAIAGLGSKLHARHKLYVDIVSGSLPFLAPLAHSLYTVAVQTRSRSATSRTPSILLFW